MRQEIIIHGVPDSIRLDAWWLETTAGPPQRRSDRVHGAGALLASLRMRHAIPILASLVAIADWLFWEQPPGISVAVFALVSRRRSWPRSPGGQAPGNGRERPPSHC
ncbi:hypothetical protein [Leisingera daeponensis]|uniref:hypothetical protein n=1 Tax=Leisingera daeponensis TaxID=405746 RepID=UPI001C96D931|nr:hypothetical protein [Leisingera daeponensis]MBY6059347.1 hypothetical protein [Leisingera daeponensis]